MGYIIFGAFMYVMGIFAAEYDMNKNLRKYGESFGFFESVKLKDVEG